MYHEWECPDCGHELHHECEITEIVTPQGDSEYCGDPDDPLCGPDMGKPWCAYHEGTDETPEQSTAIVDANLRNMGSQGLDIFRIIANRLEQQRILEENEQTDKRFRKGLNDV